MNTNAFDYNQHYIGPEHTMLGPEAVSEPEPEQYGLNGQSVNYKPSTGFPYVVETSPLHSASVKKYQSPQMASNLSYSLPQQMVSPCNNVTYLSAAPNKSSLGGTQPLAATAVPYRTVSKTSYQQQPQNSFSQMPSQMSSQMSSQMRPGQILSSDQQQQHPIMTGYRQSSVRTQIPQSTMVGGMSQTTYSVPTVTPGPAIPLQGLMPVNQSSSPYQYTTTSSLPPNVTRTMSYTSPSGNSGPVQPTTTTILHDYSDSQLYRPDGAMYVAPSGNLRGGMSPLYNMAEVRTYEAPPIFAAPTDERRGNNNTTQMGMNPNGRGPQMPTNIAAGQNIVAERGGQSDVSSVATSHLKKAHHKHQAKQRMCC